MAHEFERKLPPGLFLEGFEEGNDEDDDDKNEWKGGQDGAGLETFESTGPEEDGCREGLNNAPCEFNVIRWVEAAIGGERSQYECGRVCRSDEKGAD